MSDMNECQECGMIVEPGEYHPYGVCLMMMGSRESDVVRINVNAMKDHFQSEAAAEIERLRERIRQLSQYKNTNEREGRR